MYILEKKALLDGELIKQAIIKNNHYKNKYLIRINIGKNTNFKNFIKDISGIGDSQIYEDED